MKIRNVLRPVGIVLTGLAFVAVAHAQTGLNTELPPPAMNDPGVKPVPPSTVSTADELADDALPGGLISRDESPPNVNIRREGEDIVQEYSHNGRVYMITVIPKKGVTQTYRDINGDGRLDIEPGRAPVAPVYYTLYEWGKPKPAQDSD